MDIDLRLFVRGVNVFSVRVNGLGYCIGVDNDFLIACGQKMTWVGAGIEISLV